YNIWQLAWPAALASILMNFAHIVDRMFIGMLGRDPVTAVGFTGSLIWLGFALVELVTAGVVAIVARCWGAGELDEANASGHRGLWFGCAIALFLVAAMELLAPFLLRLYGPTPEQYAIGIDYLRIFAPGFGALVCAFTVHSVFVGSGDTRTGMYAFAAVNILNVFLNWLLIFGNWGFPRMGVNGAALASSISAFVGLGVILAAYRFGWSNASLKGFFRHPPVWRELKRFFKIGLPAMGHSITRPLTGVIMIALASSLKTCLPDGREVNLVATAFTIGMSTLIFGQFLSNGLMAAPAPLVGQFLGRGEPLRAKESAQKAALFGVAIGCLLAGVYILFGRELAQIFLQGSSTPVPLAAAAERLAGFVRAEGPLLPWRVAGLLGSGGYSLTRPVLDTLANQRVLDMSHNYLIFIGLGSIFSSMAWTFGGGFRGAGDTAPPMWGAILANWAVKVPVALLLIHVFHLHDFSIWLAVMLSQVFEGLFVALWFRRGRWMTKKV
ncbi:MAG TPA: MATE family efflux transporter, partial [Candidatus Coatesbacteria bacterium]|nr:MATE family efflux transporter [Candidatus Coatesbacteria bacterium]